MNSILFKSRKLLALFKVNDISRSYVATSNRLLFRETVCTKCVPKLVKLTSSNTVVRQFAQVALNGDNQKNVNGANQPGKRATRRRPKKLEERSSSNSWNVIAYAVAEELDFDNLIVGLNKQGLYQSAILPDDVENGLHMLAKYQVEKETREVYIFREGTVVFWNFPEIERLAVLRFLKTYGEYPYEDDMVHDEREVLEYSHNNSDTRLVHGKIILNSEKTVDLEKYAFSDALSVSVKLAMWERTLDQFVDSIENITEDLKFGRRIKLTRDQVLRKMGELFTLRHHLNLSSDLLDTPDFYWERESLEPLYQKTAHYLSIAKRTKVMNDKMNHCQELVQLLSDHLTDVHHVRLEVMIIALITIEVVFEAIHWVI